MQMVSYIVEMADKQNYTKTSLAWTWCRAIFFQPILSFLLGSFSPSTKLIKEPRWDYCSVSLSLNRMQEMNGPSELAWPGIFLMYALSTQSSAVSQNGPQIIPILIDYLNAQQQLRKAIFISSSDVQYVQTAFFFLSQTPSPFLSLQSQTRIKNCQSDNR